MTFHITLEVFQTTEKLPRKYRRVLAYFPPNEDAYDTWMVAAQSNSGWYAADDRLEEAVPDPTHWAEIPASIFGPAWFPVKWGGGKPPAATPPGCALDFKILQEHWRKQWESVAQSAEETIWGPPWNQDPLEKMPDLDE